MGTAEVERVKQQIQVWANELIDLTRRNTSLFYRRTKRSTLEIERPDVSKLLTRLKSGERLAFFEPPPLEPGQEWTIEDSLERAKQDEIVTRRLSSSDLRATLRNIARTSEQDFLDRGLQTLYLGIGILKWQETPDADWVRSPIVYIPIQLDHPSPKELHRLLLSDEDPVLNLGLQVVLRNDHDIELGDIGVENIDEPEELEAVLRQVAERVKVNGWSIEERVILKRATFHKEAMYSDLLANKEYIADHPIIRILADDNPELDDLWDDPIPSESQMDEVAPPEDSLTILDADASQRVAIHIAKKGRSFVMDGPPGTGKSQTIANMIAELIGCGKSVLFVSEKVAALEVVYKRLQEFGLHDYLLQLHSHKATRKEVVQDLYRSLTSRPKASPRMNADQQSRFVRLRKELTAYAEAVNECRQPLGQSLIDVLGRLSLWKDIPTPPPPKIENPIAMLTVQKFVEFQETFEALARVWAPVENPEFLWRGYREDCVSAADLGQLERSLNELVDGIPLVDELANQLCLALALRAATRESDARRAVLVARHLADQPITGRLIWTTEDFDAVLRTYQDARQASKQIQQGRDELNRQYGPNFQSLEAAPAQAALDVLAHPFPPPKPYLYEDGWPGRAHLEIAERMEKISHSLEEYRESFQRVANGFGLDTDSVALSSMRDLSGLAIRSGAVNRPIDAWCSPGAISEVSSILDDLHPLTARYHQLRERVSEVFSESIFCEDINGLIVRFNNTHVSFWRFFTASFWRDRRVIKSSSLDQKFSPGHVESLKIVQETLKLGAEIDNIEDESRALLGPYHRSRACRIDDARDALETIRRARKLSSPDFNPNAVIASFCGSAPSDATLPHSGEQVSQFLAGLTSELKGTPIEHICSLSLPSSITWLNMTATHLRVRWKAIQSFVDMRNSSPSVGELKRDLAQAVDLRKAEEDFASNQPTYQRFFSSLFSGPETDWDQVSVSLAWVAKLRALLGEPPSENFVKMHHGSEFVADPDTLEARLESNRRAFEEVFDRFQPDHRHELTAELNHSFPDDLELVWNLRETIDEAEVWVNYVRRRSILEGHGFKEVLGFCEAQGVTSDHLAPVLMKALLAHWVESVLPNDDRLKLQRADDRDDLVRQFRILDRLLIEDAVERVVSLCNGRRPNTGVGPAGVIKKEALKKRRHMPVRKLLAETVEVVTRLKPCFMMSPLSVSQFLPPGYRFDVVIFDEASQVNPSDSINCIYRGNQLVVAGDENQLPPSNFFQRSVDSDEDTYDEEQFDEFESILTLCLGTHRLPQVPLRWHYRSRNESLITFSNYRFYTPPGLVTFPSCRGDQEDEGVEFIQVDGMYRRGSTRDNPAEAEKVAERVLWHARKNPNMKLGVVAFSAAQEAAIEDAVYRMREMNPDIERFFDRQDRLDGFFIKNLETVQGDERDVIIFSVGYGPDENGKTTLNFGPLNREGGWRRLNVAITRARLKVEVIASFSPGELNVSQTRNRGVKELIRYLEYAVRGLPALSLDLGDGDRDVESPFEESVLETVRSWGYDVVPQVGAAGYRIDLGVRHPNRPGEFVLGIECDGAMYHSSKVARDRDRLRQEVLVRLGWSIYRIWGPAWYRARRDQEQRLRAGIESAIDSFSWPEMNSPGHHHHNDRPAEQVELDSTPTWAEPYEIAEVTISGRRDPASPESWVRLQQAIIKIIEVEAPITEDFLGRRLADSFNHRLTKRFRDAIATCLRAVTVQTKWTLSNCTVSEPERELRVRVPTTSKPESVRKLQDIPMEEVQLAITLLIEDAGLVTEEELMVSIRSLFGFDRTGPLIRNVLSEAINKLIESGELLRENGDTLRSTSTNTGG